MAFCNSIETRLLLSTEKEERADQSNVQKHTNCEPKFGRACCIYFLFEALDESQIFVVHPVKKRVFERYQVRSRCDHFCGIVYLDAGCRFIDNYDAVIYGHYRPQVAMLSGQCFLRGANAQRFLVETVRKRCCVWSQCIL
ncbi:uncharacterized protein [Drosophila suzukii]|uniref:Uncharacterized protein n=1 Tax=Drosophila suzukii TaxID=28584 RepID=A0ABM4TX44_DROSZ